MEKIKTVDSFIKYLCIHQEYEYHHRYFDPRLRYRSEELLKYYLYERFKDYKKDPSKRRVKKEVKVYPRDPVDTLNYTWLKVPSQIQTILSYAGFGFHFYKSLRFPFAITNIQ